MRIILTSKHSKERTDASVLKKNMDNFNFVMRIIIWERILTYLHRVSQQLQAINTDLSASVRLLSAAYGELQYMRDSWDSVLMSANAMRLSWGIKPEFTSKRQRRIKKFHDELSSDSRLTDPAQAFKVDVFYKLIDVALNQLELRFEGQQQVAELFRFLFPDTMLKLSDAEIEIEANGIFC